MSIYGITAAFFEIGHHKNNQYQKFYCCWKFQFLNDSRVILTYLLIVIVCMAELNTGTGTAH